MCRDHGSIVALVLAREWHTKRSLNRHGGCTGTHSVLYTTAILQDEVERSRHGLMGMARSKMGGRRFPKRVCASCSAGKRFAADLLVYDEDHVGLWAPVPEGGRGAGWVSPDRVGRFLCILSHPRCSEPRVLPNDSGIPSRGADGQWPVAGGV